MCGTLNSKIKNGIASVCLMLVFFFWEILRQIVQQFLKKKREHYMYISVLVKRDPREMSTHE